MAPEWPGDPAQATAARHSGAGAGAAARAVARNLTLAWLSLATVAIGLATLYAIVLVIARVPQVARVLPAGDLFHTALVLHVDLAALIWFFAMAGALWSLTSSPRLIRLRWAAFGLSAGGVAAVALAPISAGGVPIANNYVPVLDTPLFLSGLVWFFAGTASSALIALLLPRPAGEAPAARFGLRVAAILALAAFGAFLTSALALPEGLDRGLYFELLSWAPGHIAQFAFTVLMLVAWLMLALQAGLGIPGRGLLWAVWALAALPLLPALLLLALYAPDAVLFRKGYTALMAFGAWPAPLLLAGWLVAKLVRGPRVPEHGAARTTIVFSMLLFTVGCVLGVFIRTDSTMVPAHYHGTVGGVTLSLMGLLLQFGWRLRGVAPPAAARWLPWIYGSGLAMMLTGLAWLAAEGAPRKMPLGDATSASLGHLVASSLTGLGGGLAIMGGVLFVWLAARALWQRQGLALDPADLLVLDAKNAPVASASRRRDVRPRALLLTVGGVLVLGLTLAAAPNPAALRGGIADLLAGFAPVDKSSHAAEKRREEIAQRFSQGVIMLHAKQYEHAVTAFHRVLALDPEMPEAHANMGFALIGLERYSAARDFFQSALALRKDQLNAYYGLAEALEGLGDLPAALGAMRTYVHLAPPDDPFRTKAEAALWVWQDQIARERTATRPPVPAPARPEAKK